MKVGVVGKHGFIGKHIVLNLNQLNLGDVVPIGRKECESIEVLSKHVAGLDVLIIASGVNKSDSQDLYDVNINMIRIIIDCLFKVDFHGRIIFLSSIHNEKNTSYGRAKRDSESLLKEIADSNMRVDVMVLPNIFGESQKPYYNCVVPTFIDEILSDSVSEVADASVELLHVRHVVEAIKSILLRPSSIFFDIHRLEGKVISVACLHAMLRNFLVYKKEQVGTIPELEDCFTLDLFNTFRYMCWIKGLPLSGKFILHADERGLLFEVLRTNTIGQIFFSTTKPGSVRGGHFHTRKIERFAMISGHSEVNLKSLFGDFDDTIVCNQKEGMFVDVPNYTMHKVTNVGSENVQGIFWVNELFDPEDSDTYSINPK